MLTGFNIGLAIALIILIFGLQIAVRRFKRYIGRRRLQPFERRLFVELGLRRFDNFKGIFEENKANPNLRDFNGSPMILAAAANENSIEFLEYLISKGADVNAKDIRDRTALFYTSYVGALKPVMKLIRSKNIDLNATNKSLGFEVNPLTAALYRNRLEVFKALLDAGADPVLAENLIKKNPKHFEHYKDEFMYKRILETYLRWHRGQKHIIFVKKMTEKHRNSSQQEESKTNVNLKTLNQAVFKTIITEFL